jgi:hypothetical protein
MGSAIVKLIPMMLGAAAVPFCVIIVFLLLRSPDGLFKASAFAGGQILVRLVQGIGFGSELGYSAVAQTKQGASGIINTLILVAGILMWITALKNWAKQEDPDTPPPWWMAVVGSVSRLKAFGLGIVATAGSGKQWILTFYALGVIRVADLPSPRNAVVFLVFILGAQSLVLVPIGLYACAPRHSSRLLETGALWLERNNQTIVIVVSVVFGTFFIFKGILGFLQ